MSDKEAEDLGGAEAGMGGDLRPLDSGSTALLQLQEQTRGRFIQLAGWSRHPQKCQGWEASKDPL